MAASCARASVVGALLPEREGRESIFELDDETLITRVKAELREICGLVESPLMWR